MNDVPTSSGSTAAPRRSPAAERARRTRRRLCRVAAVLAALGAVYAVAESWLHFTDYRERADKAAVLGVGTGDPATAATFDATQNDLVQSVVAYAVVGALLAVATVMLWRAEMWMLVATSAACAISFVLVAAFAVRQGESVAYLAPWLVLIPVILMLAWVPWFFSNTNEP